MWVGSLSSNKPRQAWSKLARLRMGYSMRRTRHAWVDGRLKSLGVGNGDKSDLAVAIWNQR